MKTSLSLLFTLAASSSSLLAGSESPRPLNEHLPVLHIAGAPIEVSAFAGVGMKNLYKNYSDSHHGIIGGDLTAVLEGFEHGLTLRFGYGYGEDSLHVDSLSGGNSKINSDLHTFYLMPGYRYTSLHIDRWTWHAGFNLGLANMSVKSKIDSSGLPLQRHHDSDYGLAYSAEAGLRYALDDRLIIFCAYEFFGHLANPVPGGELPTNRPHYHMIRVGVGFWF